MDPASARECETQAGDSQSTVSVLDLLGLWTAVAERSGDTALAASPAATIDECRVSRGESKAPSPLRSAGAVHIGQTRLTRGSGLTICSSSCCPLIVGP